MSIPVELHALAETVARFPFAYLLTSSEQGPPHAVAVVPRIDGHTFIVEKIGRRTGANAQARPAVGLVWPPRAISDYSLIVDGQASLDGETMRIAPTRAVLHRPAAGGQPAEPGACAADCVRVKVG